MAEFGQLIPAFTPPVTTVTVPFKEYQVGNVSPVISVEGDGNGTRVERTFLMKASDTYQFSKDALGFAQVQSSGGPILRRTMPWFDPGYNWLPATRISRIVGLNWPASNLRSGGGPTNNVISSSPMQSILTYEQALVTVEFSEVDYPIINDTGVDNLVSNGASIIPKWSPSASARGQAEFCRYVTFTRDSSVDYLSIPTTSKNRFVWTDGPDAGNPIPDAPGKSLPGETFHYRWRRVPYQYAPHTTIKDCLGAVNKYPFAGCDAGTLLFIARDQELRKQVNGDAGISGWVLDLVYHMKYFPTGWNQIFDWNPPPPHDPDFFQIGSPGYPSGGWVEGSIPDGKTIYKERDLFTLFTLEA